MYSIPTKQVQINNSKLFDQFCNLKTYASELDEEEVSLAKQWVKFFKKCPNPELNSELLIICHFYFANPSHNANVERVFFSNKFPVDQRKEQTVSRICKRTYICKFDVILTVHRC